MDLFTILLSKPTLFSVLGMTSIILGTTFGIKISRKKGPQAMAALLFFGFVFLSIIGLIIDRILVSYISPLRLSKYELLFIFLLILFKAILDKYHYKY